MKEIKKKIINLIYFLIKCIIKTRKNTVGNAVSKKLFIMINDSALCGRQKKAKGSKVEEGSCCFAPFVLL